jgi:hypothetical protein
MNDGAQIGTLVFVSIRLSAHVSVSVFRFDSFFVVRRLGSYLLYQSYP